MLPRPTAEGVGACGSIVCLLTFHSQTINRSVENAIIQRRQSSITTAQGEGGAWRGWWWGGGGGRSRMFTQRSRTLTLLGNLASVILVRSANFQMHFRLQRLLNQTRYLKSAQKEQRKRQRDREKGRGDSSKADILEKCRKTVEGNANFHSSRHWFWTCFVGPDCCCSYCCCTLLLLLLLLLPLLLLLSSIFFGVNFFSLGTKLFCLHSCVWICEMQIETATKFSHFPFSPSLSLSLKLWSAAVAQVARGIVATPRRNASPLSISLHVAHIDPQAASYVPWTEANLGIC